MHGKIQSRSVILKMEPDFLDQWLTMGFKRKLLGSSSERAFLCAEVLVRDLYLLEVKDLL